MHYAAEESLENVIKKAAEINKELVKIKNGRNKTPLGIYNSNNHKRKIDLPSEPKKTLSTILEERQKQSEQKTESNSVFFSLA